jgi:23S rRNA pseudouridine1911/1915/1917 synthase
LKAKKLDIIYEDKYIIAVNKPTKLLSISTLKEKEKTLYNEVSMYVKKKHKSNKIFVVHRLDKDTSGVMVFAKDVRVKNVLQANWEKYAVERKYLAFVSGKISPKENTLKNKLVTTKTYDVFVDDNSKFGKLAITKYKLIKYLDNNSLIDVLILTGRKNQIRAQLDYYGYPIIGDFKYGKIKTKDNRLMLHAFSLKLIHPVTNEKLYLEAKLPKEFKKII